MSTPPTPQIFEVTTPVETLALDLGAVVSIQQRGENHFIHTTGGAIPVSREAAVQARAAWRRYTASR